MKASIHQIIEDSMQALGPVFHKHQDWEDIRVAFCFIMARVIQATPHKGLEDSILTQSQQDIADALAQILKLEEEAINAKAAARDRALSGIESFAGFSVVNGNEPGPDIVGNVHVDPHLAPAPTEEEITRRCEEDFIPTAEEINDAQSAMQEEQAEMERGIEAHDDGEEDGYNPDGPRAYL